MLMGYARTYPKQIGIKPFPMKWGAADPKERGPIVVSRYASTIRKRNGAFAIGFTSGAWEIANSFQLSGLTEVLTPSTMPWLLLARSSRLITGTQPAERVRICQLTSLDDRPDFTNTEPTASLGPFPAWGDPKKIVAMDPWGHLAPWLFKDIIDKDDSTWTLSYAGRIYADDS